VTPAESQNAVRSLLAPAAFRQAPRNTFRTVVEVPNALMNADFMGQFLALGGRTAYLFGYEPSRPISERSPCANYAQLMLLEGDQPMPTYFAARLITEDWAQPINRWHKLYAANSDITDAKGHKIVTAYVVKRPDHRWAVMLLNKDSAHAYVVHVSRAFGRCGQRSRAQDATQPARCNPVILSINPPTAHPVLCVEPTLLQFWDGPR
jgi:hypothetical protein